MHFMKFMRKKRLTDDIYYKSFKKKIHSHFDSTLALIEQNLSFTGTDKCVYIRRYDRKG